MITLGVAITALTATVLVVEWLRHRKRALPVSGWAALALLLLAEWMMFRGVEPAATFFTAIAWTCFIVLADAAVYSITGRSRLLTWPREFARVALLSIPLWLIFEAYNLRLENWMYVGLPENWFVRMFGYAWAFATITPAIFITADLVRAFGWFGAARPVKTPRWLLHGMVTAGVLMLTIPVALPSEYGAYLFGSVWLGFILLLEPLNYAQKLPSLIGDLERGCRDRLYALLISGWVCGWLWEFWNNWAAAKWLYIFPMFQQWKIFEMPAPGYLGFPPFAIECFVMYVAVARLVGWLQPAAPSGTSSSLLEK